jgi:chromosome segregation ATPase
VIGGSLLGNVIVYVVGTIIAYLMHDPNPEYPEKKRELDGIEKERQALQTKLDGMRQRELERLEAVLQKQRQRIKSLESLQKRSPLYARNRQWFAELQQQDANLLAALQDFKDRYIAALGEAGTATFYWRNEDDEQIALSPAQFHGLPVKLKYGHI